MTEYHKLSIAQVIAEAGVSLDRQPAPDRDKETIGTIIQAHMPIDEMTKEASDKDD